MSLIEWRRGRWSVADYDLTYLSFGAGVQSTALLALCVLEEPGFPRPDLVIHAETQSELEDTDAHTDYMQAWCSECGVRMVRPTAGSLERVQLGFESSRDRGFRVSIPAFTGEGGTLRRQCTREFKIDPIHRAVREALGARHGEVIAGKKRARALIGISRDEADRMRSSGHSWIDNVYPLVDARMARWDCVDTIKRLGLPVPPKSSCVFCPYHSDEQWDWIKRERPQAWARAVAVDESIRDGTRLGANEPAYLHRRKLPLAEVDFDAILKERRAQGSLFGDDRGGFGNECEGMCGT